jgi:hypothetical protein
VVLLALSSDNMGRSEVEEEKEDDDDDDDDNDDEPVEVALLVTIPLVIVVLGVISTKGGTALNRKIHSQSTR